MASSKRNDYDPDEIAVTKEQVGKHQQHIQEITRELKDVKESVKTLNKKLGTNEAIAETLYSASITQTKVTKLVRDTLNKALASDQEVKDNLKKIVEESDKHARNLFLKKFFKYAWQIILLIVGAAIGVVSQKVAGIWP